MKYIALVLVAVIFQLACSNPSTPVASNTASTKEANELRVSLEGIDAAEPAIASNGENIFVAYVERTSDGGGDLFVRSYDAKTKKLGEPIRVNKVPGEAKTWNGDPPTLAVDQAGAIHVGWTAKYPDKGKGTILYHSKSTDSASTFAEPTRVNDDTKPASHGMHSMAIAPDGRIVFSWLDERYLKDAPKTTHHQTSADPAAEPDAELYFAISTDNGKTFVPNKRIDENVCPCCKTSTLVSPAGEIFIGYRKVYAGEFRHITLIKSSDGATFDPPVLVSDDKWKITACPVSGPALRIENDMLNVAWYSGGEARPHGMYTALFSLSQLNPILTPVTIDTFEGAVSPTWAGKHLVYSKEGQIRSKSADTQTTDLTKGKNVTATQVGTTVIYAFVSEKSVWINHTTN